MSGHRSKEAKVSQVLAGEKEAIENSKYAVIEDRKKKIELFKFFFF